MEPIASEKYLSAGDVRLSCHVTSCDSSVDSGGGCGGTDGH